MTYRRPGFLAVVSYDSAPSPPPPTSPVSNLFIFLSLPVTPVDFTDDRGGWEGVGEEPNYTTARKPGLYKSFNNLRVILLRSTILFLN
jgi:hypothetical protein